jgi:hypothetical protein
MPLGWPRHRAADFEATHEARHVPPAKTRMNALEATAGRNHLRWINVALPG